MRKLLAALAGILGIAWLRRRKHEPAQPVGPDPADELRTKLAQAREAAEPREEDEAGETTVDAAPDPEPDVAERRRDVHDRARAAIDELSGGE